MGGERTIKSVAIIGAGPAGTAAAAAFNAEQYFEKIRVFERRETPGGTWIYDVKPSEPPPISPGALPPSIDPPLIIPKRLPQTLPHDRQERYQHTPIYESLFTNVPEIAMSFSDQRFAYGPFVPHWVARRYLESYFSLHKIDKLLAVNTTVENVAKVLGADGAQRWRLTLRKYDAVREVDEWWEEVFDAVVFATGHFSVPYVPRVKGLEEYVKAYPGRVLHSKNYRHAFAYANKKVIVVGNSASGHDITEDLAKTVRVPVYQSRRTKSRWDHDQPMSGVEWKPVIEEFVPSNGRIIFEDGSYLDDVDQVLYCTGYNPSYPFWNSDANGGDLYDYGKKKVNGTYLHTFFSQHPTMGMVGWAHVLAWRSYEFQAIALARVFSGRNPRDLPSSSEQFKWEDAWEKSAAEAGRDFYDIPWDDDESFPWHQELAQIAGLGTMRGKGRVPPIFSDETLWQLKHIKKYSEPINGIVAWEENKD